MEQSPHDTESNEYRHEACVEQAKKQSAGLDVLRQTRAHRFREEALASGEREKRGDWQSHRVKREALQEHPTQGATQAAGQPATDAWQTRGALTPTDRHPKSV